MIAANGWVPRAPEATSISSIRRFVSTPPTAEKPPSFPFAAMTRWHGTKIGKGFRPRARPTARADPRWPDRSASWPYEIVWPLGMVRARSYTRRSRQIGGPFEHDRIQLPRTAPQQARNAFNHENHPEGRLLFERSVGGSTQHRPAQSLGCKSRELHRNDPLRPPGDCAFAEGGGKAAVGELADHDRMLNTSGGENLEYLAQGAVATARCGICARPDAPREFAAPLLPFVATRRRAEILALVGGAVDCSPRTGRSVQ